MRLLFLCRLVTRSLDQFGSWDADIGASSMVRAAPLEISMIARLRCEVPSLRKRKKPSPKTDEALRIGEGFMGKAAFATLRHKGGGKDHAVIGQRRNARRLCAKLLFVARGKAVKADGPAIKIAQGTRRSGEPGTFEHRFALNGSGIPLAGAKEGDRGFAHILPGQKLHRRDGGRGIGNEQRVDLALDLGDLLGGALQVKRIRLGASLVFLDAHDADAELGGILAQRGFHHRAIGRAGQHRGDGMLALSRREGEDALDIILRREVDEIDPAGRSACIGGEGDHRHTGRLEHHARLLDGGRPQRADDQLCALGKRLPGHLGGGSIPCPHILDHDLQIGRAVIL